MNHRFGARGGSIPARRGLIGLSLVGLGLLFPLPGGAQVAKGDLGVGPVSDTIGRDPEAFPRPTATAIRISDNIVLDGDLSETSWQAADVITDFIQSMPDAGYPATEDTEVRILYDDRNLYVGALLFDSEPEGIIAQFLEQDYETHQDDVFAVTLDTFLDRRNSFMFLINPNGAVKDGQTFDNSRVSNLAWEGVVHIETRVHDRGWTVEMAIPFTTLRFDPREDTQAWGMNFLRRVRRKNEDSYWAPVDRRSRVHTMAVAGTVDGFSGLPRPRNLTVKPFVLADDATGDLVAEGQRGTGYDGGLDLKYGITPRLTLDLSYRTDFSQVEVDQEQVNLTRFSLFFPEKRDFFMENAGVFTFGDISERNFRMGTSLRDFTLFHSRRIGLDQGRPVPITGGGRLTGRIGSLDVGLLNMQTESTEALPRESFTVGRIRRTFENGFQVGGLVTSRDEAGDGSGYNRSYGVDASLSVRGKLVVHSYLAATDYPDREGNNRATRLAVAYRDRLWDASALFREIGDAFRPGMGFVARTGIRHSYVTVGLHPRPEIPTVSEINPYAELHYITDLDSSLETREGTVGLGVDFLDGGRLAAQASDRFEGIDEPFNVAGEGEVPSGRYDFQEASLSYTSSMARPLSGMVRVSGGGFYNGDRRSLSVTGAWRPNRHFAVDLLMQRNEIDLPGREFTADVFGTRLDFAASRRLFLTAFLQYNAASEEAVTNIRLNFLHSPLSDLFIVFQERRDMDGDELLERSVAFKATKLLSF